MEITCADDLYGVAGILTQNAQKTTSKSMMGIALSPLHMVPTAGSQSLALLSCHQIRPGCSFMLDQAMLAVSLESNAHSEHLTRIHLQLLFRSHLILVPLNTQLLLLPLSL